MTKLVTEFTAVKGTNEALITSHESKAFGLFLSSVTNNGETVVEFDVPRQFVPSFDKKEESAVMRLNYTNASEGVPGTILVKGTFNILSGDIILEGEGFDSVILVLETEDLVVIEEKDVVSE
jgi:hypothetical protein